MKSALLSKIAMCVCPPAIVATSAVTVPPIKRAVHRITAPAAAPARPRPRRVFAAAYDCTPTAVPLSNPAPLGMTAVTPNDVLGNTPVAPTALTAVPVTPASFGPVALGSPPFTGPLYPLVPSTIPPVTPPSVLPEVSTWAMTITGFGAIGWALRRRPRDAATAEA